MHKTIDQLYDSIKDLKSKEEFLKEIKNRYKEYDDLLDENTIAFLIVDELGRNKQNICNIADLINGMECTLYGRVVKIGDSRDFKRKNGTTGRVVNLDLNDNTGTCRLVLWGKDVELIKNKSIKKGTNVKIINGYVKEGYNSLEINSGRWGLIEIEPDDMPEVNHENIKSDSIKGTIVEMMPTRPFFRDSGDFGFVTNIKIKKIDNTVDELTLWDEKVKEIQNLKVGNKVEFENVDIRQKNGNIEIHVNGKSIIKKI